MGNRRLGRARLYTIEKQGQTIDLEPGAGISPAIARTTQHRLGQELITEIVVDLGSSAATGTIMGGGEHKVIGIVGKPAHLGRLTRAKVGIVTEIRAVVTETPTGGAVKLDVVGGTAATDVRGGTVTGAVAGPADIDDVGEDTSVTNSADDWANLYLYITNATGDSNTGAQTGGKVIITIYGFAVPDDL